MRRPAGRVALGVLLALGGCSTRSTAPESYYGTLEPFASEAVYLVLTDRFVNGDPSNDQREQGGAQRTFDRPLAGPDGATDNLGYLGGDFKGLLDHADYIRDLGFSAVWITPIVDNPDAAFTGGDAVSWGSFLTDRGKTGYHGYWGVNFYRLDEHLPSAGLDFAGFTRGMHERNLKVVLDIVANHGSPAFTMPTPQPEFGKLYAPDGTLLADHQNLPPPELDPQGNPLHAFFQAEPDLAQLSNLDQSNPAVREYLIGSVLQWLGQGADALRIDTIRHVPHSFWREFSERVRAERPGLFMFGESFDFDASNIAAYTQAAGGAMSVLDFPLQKQLTAVFERSGTDFGLLESALYLESGPYRNPYELMTFYDNHDMARFDGSAAGLIDMHHWLFTARGIPVVYYGSEMGFMRGAKEHAGNRNYFGVEGLQAAVRHPVYGKLQRIARARAGSPALQRGLQLNVRMRGDEAVFYRVYQHQGTAQTALVVINKGDAARSSVVSEYLEPGRWRDAFSGQNLDVKERLELEVPAHDVRVLLYDGPVRLQPMRRRLQALSKVVPRDDDDGRGN